MGLALFCAVALNLTAQAAIPEQVAAARSEITQIQSAFLREVQAATNLSSEEIDKFMPGGALYGRDIPEFHRLRPSQLEALRQADNRKKSAIMAVRQKHGIPTDAARAAGSRY